MNLDLKFCSLSNARILTHVHVQDRALVGIHVYVPPHIEVQHLHTCIHVETELFGGGGLMLNFIL